MKESKGSQRPPKKVAARFKSMYLKPNDAGLERLLVSMPDAPPSRIKASVTAMPLTYTKEELRSDGKGKKETRLQKKERKKKIKAAAIKAQMAVPTQEGTVDAKPDAKPVVSVVKEKVTVCNNPPSNEVIKPDSKVIVKLSNKERRAVRLAKKLVKKQEREQIAKLEESVQQDDNKANEERAVVGPVEQKTVEKVSPVSEKPEPTVKKDSVKPQLTVVPTGNEPKVKGKIHHFGKSKVASNDNATTKKKTVGYSGLARKEKPKHVAALAKVEVQDTELYGTCVRDTGIGMTPSGMRISDFEVGGSHAPPLERSVYVPAHWAKTSDPVSQGKLQAVTSSNGDYSYEELGELLDMANTEVLRVKTDLAVRIERFNVQFSTMGKTLVNMRAVAKLKGISETDADAEVVGELQDLNTLLTEDNDALREEVSKLSDFIEDLERHVISDNDKDVPPHHMQSNGTFKKVSVTSPPAMKTLGLQYKIFANEVSDDPVRAFLKHTGYPLVNLKPLKLHFDEECESRLKTSAELQAVTAKERCEEEFIAHYDATELRKKQLDEERSVYVGWGNRYATLEPTRGDVGGRVISGFLSYYVVRSKAERTAYERWWKSNLSVEDAKLRDLRQSFTAKKIVLPAKKLSKAIKDVMLTELDPRKRKANRIRNEKKAKLKAETIQREMNRGKTKPSKSVTKSSAIKRKMEQDSDKALQLEQAREAMRIAH